MENQELIKRFLKHKQVTNRSKKQEISIGTIDQYQKALSYLDQHINKPYTEATQDDIENHLGHYKQSVRNQHITIFKMFYGWLYKQQKQPMPTFWEDIKAKSIQINDTEYAKRVISPNDYQNILDHCKTPMQRALLEALWISGGRKIGIQKLLLADVQYDGRFTRITIRVDKTEPREIIYDGRAEHLMKWVESLHPYAGKKTKKEEPLFVTDWGTDGRYKPIGPNYAWDLLDRICDKLKMRHIKTHDIRHTVCTNMLKNGIPDTHVKTIMGWSKSSDMLRVYDHNSIKDYQEFLERNAEQTKPTYELLEKQKEELEQKQEKKIDKLQKMLTDFSRVMMTNIELSRTQMREDIKNGVNVEKWRKYQKDVAEMYNGVDFLGVD